MSTTCTAGLMQDSSIMVRSGSEGETARHRHVLGQLWLIPGKEGTTLSASKSKYHLRGNRMLPHSTETFRIGTVYSGAEHTNHPDPTSLQFSGDTWIPMQSSTSNFRKRLSLVPQSLPPVDLTTLRLHTPVTLVPRRLRRM